MPIDLEDGTIVVHEGYGSPVTRRDTNTVIVKLAQDEVLTLISDLATKAYMGDVVLVIEKQDILVREVFD